MITQKILLVLLLTGALVYSSATSVGNFLIHPFSSILSD